MSKNKHDTAAPGTQGGGDILHSGHGAPRLALSIFDIQDELTEIRRGVSALSIIGRGLSIVDERHGVAEIVDRVEARLDALIARLGSEADQ